MKNKPSDLEKAITFLPPAMGICLIVFVLVALVSRVSIIAGIVVFIFALIIIGIGLYFFIDRNEEEDDDELDEDDDSEDDAEEESDAEADEDADSEENVEKTKNNFVPAFYTSHEENTENWLKALFSPTQIPITTAAAWFIVVIIGYNLFPGIAALTSKSAFSSLFIVLPVLFLLGLNGFLGILLKQPSESLETTPKEKTDYVMNVFKILAGWGTGIYALWAYLQNQ